MSQNQVFHAMAMQLIGSAEQFEAQMQAQSGDVLPPITVKAPGAGGGAPSAAEARRRSSALRRRRSSAQRENQRQEALLSLGPRRKDKIDLDNMLFCSCQDRCRRALATKKCYSCVKYDPKQLGNYCDACFEARHPWYRVPHHWTSIIEAAEPEFQWLRQKTRVDMERYFVEIRDTLKTANQFGDRLTELLQDRRGHDLVYETARRIQNTQRIIESTRYFVRRSVREPPTEEEAALRIHALYRSWKCRREVRGLVAAMFQRFRDKRRKRDYWLNTASGEVTYVRPAMLGELELPYSDKPREGAVVKRMPKIDRFRIERGGPRVLAADLTQDQAAFIIQGMFHARRSRRMMRELVLSQYQRFEDAQGKSYYYNFFTGETKWTKPCFLGEDEDLEVSNFVKKPPKRRRPGQPPPTLTRKEAALMLQMAWRRRLALRKARDLEIELHHRLHDAVTGRPYFVNLRTERTSWLPPLHLLPEEVLSPRSHHKEMRRRYWLAHPLSRERAAELIQGLFRARRARAGFRQLLASMYTRHRDPNSRREFFRNRRTGAVTWVLPGGASPDAAQVLSPRSLRAREAAERARRDAELAELQREERRRFRATHPLQRAEAARLIQAYWRAAAARRLLRRLAYRHFEKTRDPLTGEYFYFHKITKRSQWTKPLALGTHEMLSPRSWSIEKKLRLRRRRRQPGWKPTRDEAARILQGVFRCNKAHRTLIRAMKRELEVFVDEAIGERFYVNKRTGAASWSKPLLLRDEELLTREERLAARRAASKARHVPRDPPPGEHEAATRAQGLFRMWRARQRCHHIVHARFQRVDDYYYDRVLGQARWHRPPFLRDDEDVLTEAERERQALAHHPDHPPAPQSEDEAAAHIQGLFRMHAARRRLVALVAGRFVKVEDPESHAVYYYDRESGRSQWTRPLVLHGDEDVLTDAEKLEAQRWARYAARPTRFGALSKREAASIVTRAMRRSAARRRLVREVRALYTEERAADGTPYYVNARSGEVRWTKPLFIRHENLLTPEQMAAEERLRRRRARHAYLIKNPMPPPVAARTIQRLARRFVARCRLHARINRRWVAVDDFVYDTATGESAWARPGPDFGLAPLLSREGLAAAAARRREMLRRARGPPSEDLAAARIQGLSRMRAAREAFLDRVQACYYRVDPPDSEGDEGRSYYVDRRSRRTSYSKPAGMTRWEEVLTEAEKAQMEREERRERIVNYYATHPLHEDEAATLIQTAWRGRAARARVAGMLGDIWEKCFDAPERGGHVYYVDLDTGEALWRKPGGLAPGWDVLTAAERQAELEREQRLQMMALRGRPSPIQAAMRIKQAWRAFAARRRLRAAIAAAYVKKIDLDSGEPYYLRLDSGAASWDKPPLLAEGDDLPLPRNALRTYDDAAARIQRCARCRQARARAADRARRVYERRYDHEWERTVFVNTALGTTLRVLPRFVRHVEVMTPRSRGLFVRGGALTGGTVDVGAQAVRRSAGPLTEDAAAVVITTLFRTVQARSAIKQTALRVYEKLSDDHGRVYYFNTRTGESLWRLPKGLRYAEF